MHQIKYNFYTDIRGSIETYHAVRAGFVSNGTSLNRWCIANGVNRQTAEKALKGERVSRKSQALINRLVSDAFGKANS